MVYGKTGTAGAGERSRANLLVEEGIEATRSIRDAGFTTIADGIYGIVQSGGVWTLSGTSDTSGIFTRKVVIATTSTNRKTVTSTVTWPYGGSTSQLSSTAELSNWAASIIVKSWATPLLARKFDIPGTTAGYKVATQGNYVYVIRNVTGAANFFVIDVTTPESPVLISSTTLAGTPTNIFVSGNYAYITNALDTAELQLVNIATPATPVVTSSYDAPGAANGLSVVVNGTTAYVTRAANSANNEFVIVNVATPTTPTRVGGYNLNVQINSVYVSGTAAYLATSSTTQEEITLNIATPATPTLANSINLSTTGAATVITGYGTNIFIAQGTKFYTLSNSTPLTPISSGSLTALGAINDISPDATHKYAFIGTSYASGEFQVINTATLATPTVLSTLDIPGTATLNGLTYNATKDRAFGADILTDQELEVLAPN